MRLVIVPGIGGSGDSHWQSVLERESPDAARLAPASSNTPDRADWVRALDELVQPTDVVVAHSLGCIAVAAWAAAGGRASGLFLVAPPDAEGPGFPDAAASFRPAALEPLGSPALVLASATDPYCTQPRAAELASAWGAPLVDLGDAGHVNAASGHGPWPEGRALLQEFTAAL